MNASAIRAGRAFVELFTDDSRMVRGLKAAEDKLKAFGKRVMGMGTMLVGMGAAIGAPMLGAVNHFAKAGDAVAKMSDRTGISVESLSQLNYVAEQSGFSAETLENGIRGLQKTMGNAERGSTRAVYAFEKVGMSFEDIQQMDPEAQFIATAEALSRIEDPSERAALAMQLMGTAGQQMLPMINSGAAGIAALRKQAEELGLTMSTEDAQAAAIFGDTLDNLNKSIKQIIFQVGAALAPVLTDIINMIIKVVTPIIFWIRENRQLVVTIAAIAAGVVAAGLSLMALGAIIWGMGAAIGQFIVLFKFAMSAIALIVNPITVVIGMLAGLGYWFFTSTEMGKQALSDLMDYFGELYDTATETFKGIADAIMAGDLELAAQIAWTGLQLAFLQGTKPLRQLWNDTLHFLTDAWFTAWAHIQKGFSNSIASIRSAWQTASNFLAKGILHVQFAGDPEGLKGALEELEGINQQEHKRIEADRKNSTEAVDKELTALLNGSNEVYNEKAAELKNEIDTLKGKLNQQIKTASEEAEEVRKNRQQNNYVFPEFSMPQMNLSSSSGTFSSMSALMFTPSNQMTPFEKKLLETTQQVAENTRPTEDERMPP